MGKLRYLDHLDILTAVVTHIAMGENIKRTAKGLAAESQLSVEAIQTVLDGFPALFKRYAEERCKDGEQLYSLHLVHAGRHLLRGEASYQDRMLKGDRVHPLDAEYLVALLDFISHRAQDEYQRGTAYMGARIAAGVSVLGALVSLFSTQLVALVPGVSTSPAASPVGVAPATSQSSRPLSQPPHGSGSQDVLQTSPAASAQAKPAAPASGSLVGGRS